MDLDALDSFDDRSPGLKKPGKRKGNAFTSRSKKKKAKQAEENRQFLDLDPETPKIRAEAAETSRRASFNRAVTLVAIMVLAALSYIAVKQSVWANPEFTLRQSFVHTKGMLTTEELRHETGLVTGMNLLTIDLAIVKQNLMRVYAVKSATVTRDFSGQLDITVEQRQPIAWVKCTAKGWDPALAGAGLLVDADGVAIPCTNRLPRFDQLPVIQHEQLDGIVLGGPITDERFRGALGLIKTMQARTHSAEDGISYINVANACALETQMKKDGLVAIFSWDNYEEELQRYDKLTAANDGHGLGLSYVNLMAETNLPAKRKQLPAAIKVTEAAAATRPRRR